MDERVAQSSLSFWEHLLFYGTETLRIVAFRYISDILFLWPTLLLLPIKNYRKLYDNEESSSLLWWRIMATFANHSGCFQHFFYINLNWFDCFFLSELVH
jgi:hypothetical protein